MLQNPFMTGQDSTNKKKGGAKPGLGTSSIASSIDYKYQILNQLYILYLLFCKTQSFDSFKTVEVSRSLTIKLQFSTY